MDYLLLKGNNNKYSTKIIMPILLMKTNFPLNIFFSEYFFHYFFTKPLKKQYF